MDEFDRVYKIKKLKANIGKRKVIVLEGKWKHIMDFVKPYNFREESMKECKIWLGKKGRTTKC